MQVHEISELTPLYTSRMSSTWEELDWAYGSETSWGLPTGSISLWSGLPGIGKTRLLVEMIKRLDSNEGGINHSPKSSMIFQGEISPARFKGEKMSNYTPRGKIWVSEDVAIDEQIEAIKTYKPDLVVTDSVQQIEEYRNGKGAKEIVRKLRNVIEQTNTHVIFISQLTRAGNAKGGTNLPHEVDIECMLTHATDYTPALFVLTVDKNRFGKSGSEVVFGHKDWGVECQSENRLNNDVSSEIQEPKGFWSRMWYGK